MDSEEEMNKRSSEFAQHQLEEKRGSIIFRYDSDPGKRTEREKLEYAVANSFYGEMPICTMNGKTHLNSFGSDGHVVPQYFNIEIDTTTISTAYNTFKEKNAINARLGDMDFEELRDVAEYYGESPADMTELELLPFVSEKICSDEKLIASFNKTWKDVSEDTQMQIIARKAIRLKVLTHNEQDGRVFYYNGTEQVGSTIEDVIAYFKNKPSGYTFIEREVRVADVVFDDLRKEPAKQVVNKLQKEQEDDSRYQSLKSRWLKLAEKKYVDDSPKVNHWSLRKRLDELQAIVIEGEKKRDADEKPNL